MPFKNFEPLPKGVTWENQCHHPEHNPPGHIVLQPGIHTWVCPSCGQEAKIIVPEPPHLALEPRKLMQQALRLYNNPFEQYVLPHIHMDSTLECDG